MAQLINEQIQQQIKDLFKQLKEPVLILFFGAKKGCAHCEETRQLVEEISNLSEKIEISLHDIVDDEGTAKQFNIDKTPGLVIAAKDDEQVIDYGVRFAGIPSGHEFNSLINDIIIVSNRDSGLSEQSRDFLKKLKEPVHLQVFVTPT